MVAAEVITITVTITTIMAITETEIIIAIIEAVATQMEEVVIIRTEIIITAMLV